MKHRVSMATNKRLLIQENGDDSVLLCGLGSEADSGMSLCQTTPAEREGGAINQSMIGFCPHDIQGIERHV